MIINDYFRNKCVAKQNFLSYNLLQKLYFYYKLITKFDVIRKQITLTLSITYNVIKNIETQVLTVVF